jgi:hypothetical protein
VVPLMCKSLVLVLPCFLASSEAMLPGMLFIHAFLFAVLFFIVVDVVSW